MKRIEARITWMPDFQAYQVAIRKEGELAMWVEAKTLDEAIRQVTRLVTEKTWDWATGE